MDARGTPTRVLRSHSQDQGAKVLADGRTPLATMVLRQPRPVLAEPGPVPADHCLRLYEQKHFGPSRPDSTQGHPEHWRRNSVPGASAAGDEGGWLSPQREILDHRARAGEEARTPRD